jgi:hypothetical protein
MKLTLAIVLPTSAGLYGLLVKVSQQTSVTYEQVAQ